MAWMIPKTIGRYRIKAEIGRGGMSTVYLAHDPRFERDVAVKLLPHELLSHATFRRRFEREAKVVAALDHPAIVPVYDFGEQDGQPYLVMRFMTGGSLGDRLKQGAVSFKDAARIINRLAAALDEVHAHHVIHRDLKPSNILFDQRDEPYISDFGTAKFIDAETKLTQTGGAVGTPAYMSPEQIQGEVVVDGRSDIYALGVILFEMLTGKHPYETNTPIGIALKHIFEPVPRILEAQPSLPAACQAILTRAMAKNREDRYPSAVSFAEAVNIVAQFLDVEAQAQTLEEGRNGTSQHRFALVLVNDEYEDATLARLVKPQADVVALANVLTHNKLGCFDEVTVLHNETADSVRRAVSHFLADKTANDLILIYFIGHAALDMKGQLYLTVRDTEHELLRATAVSNTFLAYELNNCAAYQQLLILDCHYSSTGSSKTPHLVGKAVDTGTSFSLNGRNRVILASSDMTQYVWYEDEVVGYAKPSCFTHHVVEALEMGTADTDGNGRITVDELFEHVQTRLAQQENTENPVQRPRKWSNSTHSDMVVGYRPQPAAVKALLTPLPEVAPVPPPPAPRPLLLRLPRRTWVGVALLLLLLVGVGAIWRPTDVSSLPVAGVVASQTATVTATVPPTLTATLQATATATATVVPTRATETAVPSITPRPAVTQTMTATAVLPSSVYLQPDSTSTELGFVESGESVLILGRSSLGQWYYVQAQAGFTGFIYAPRVEWAGDFDTLPQITSADLATIAVSLGTAVCPNNSCPAIGAEIYPLPGARCENSKVYRTIYLRGYGGNGSYTYYWNDVRVAGPLTNMGFGFEISNQGATSITGVGKVVSGDGQFVEEELVVTDFVCE